MLWNFFQFFKKANASFIMLSSNKMDYTFVKTQTLIERYYTNKINNQERAREMKNYVSK